MAMSTTLASARQGFLESIGEWYSGTLSTNGGASGATLVDATNLVNYANDKFNGWWALVTSGTYAGQARRVSDFAQSTGTITPTANWGGQILSGVSYELSRFHPTNQVRWALNKALHEVMPNLYKSVTCDDLVAGNWLYQGGFEDWNTGVTFPLGWDNVVGAGASVTRQAKNNDYRDWWWGQYNAYVARVGTDCYLRASSGIWPQMLDLFGKTVRLEGWAYCVTADRGRLALYTGQHTATNLQGVSGYATAGLSQLLRTDELTLPSSTANDAIEVRLQVNTGAETVYFDNVRLIGPECYTYALPQVFLQGEVNSLSIQTGGWAEGNERPCDDRGDTYPYKELDASNYSVEYDNVLGLWLLRLKTTLPVGYRMRLKGSAYMSTLSADTDTIPLNAPQMNVIYPLAASILYRSLASNADVDGATRDSYLSKADDFMRDHERLKRQHGWPRPEVKVNYGNWRY